MRKIVHLPDSSFYTELISALDFDDDTLVYNELTDEMFRFVLPNDTNQTFDSWKGNLPKYNFQDIGGVMTPSVGFGDLSDSYDSYDTDAIFSSELSSYFMLTGSIHWQKKIGGTSGDYGRDIAVDVSGNVYMVGMQLSDPISGYSMSGGIIKLDSSGNIIWQKKIIIAQIKATAVDGSGNLYITGYDGMNSFGKNDYIVIKLDTNGNVIWSKNIGSYQDDMGYAIAVDTSGNVYINGTTVITSGGYTNYGVIKLDSNGNILWQKMIGSLPDADSGFGIVVDSSGNVYVNGVQASDTYNGSDYGVIKFDSNGNVLWQKRIGGYYSDLGFDIALDTNNNVYVCGYQNSDTYGLNDYGVIKLDTNGNLLWQKKIGGTGSDMVTENSLTVDGSGNVYVNGYQLSDTNGSYDFGVVKLDTAGNLLWQKKIGGISSDKGNGLEVDGDGNVYLSGDQSSDTFGMADFAIIKMRPDQESDMSLSFGDMTLTIADTNLQIINMTLSIDNNSITSEDMNLSIGDIEIAGDTGGLVYLG